MDAINSSTLPLSVVWLHSSGCSDGSILFRKTFCNMHHSLETPFWRTDFVGVARQCTNVDRVAQFCPAFCRVHIDNQALQVGSLFIIYYLPCSAADRIYALK